MIAHFYIIPQTFNSESISDENFFPSLGNFIADYHKLILYKEENKIFIHNEVYEVVLPNGQTLGDFIFSNDTELKGEDRSLKQSLSSVLSKLPSSDIQIDEIKEEIKKNSLDRCSGVISLSKLEDFADENQIVYDTNSWFDFRRFHLGKHFSNEKYFVDECVKYFPKLFFHENNYTSIGNILNDFAFKIIKHLGALNDVLPTLLSEQEFDNHSNLLIMFSNEADLDENATLEGSKKTRLKFTFKKADGKSEELICEPHIKLSQNDKKIPKYFQNRIYFHFGKKEIEQSKILVAHIGEHL